MCHRHLWRTLKIYNTKCENADVIYIYIYISYIAFINARNAIMSGQNTFRIEEVFSHWMPNFYNVVLWLSMIFSHYVVFYHCITLQCWLLYPHNVCVKAKAFFKIILSFSVVLGEQFELTLGPASPSLRPEDFMDGNGEIPFIVGTYVRVLDTCPNQQLKFSARLFHWFNHSVPVECYSDMDTNCWAGWIPNG